MARPIRIEYPGAIYHVTSRGNDKQKIFRNNEERNKFLELLYIVNERFNWLCYGYCLMDNHYHLLIETLDGNLSKGMRHLNGVYTQYFNRKWKRTGHIFQGRYKSILIQKDSHLLEVCRYVVLNPVRAKMVESPANWKWSSYNGTAGINKLHKCLKPEWILGCFSKQKKKAMGNYVKFVADGIGKESIMNKVKAQCMLGTDDFIAEFEDYLAGIGKIPEIIKDQRMLNRPSLEGLFSQVGKGDRLKRDRVIKLAVRDFCYSQCEVADHLGLHYTTISGIMNRDEKH